MTRTPLSHRPVVELDDTWAAAVSPDERLALLEEADSLRGGSAEDRERACAAYRAALRPGGPLDDADLGRFRWSFDNDSHKGPLTERLAESAGSSPDPEVALRGRILGAECLAGAQRLDDARARAVGILDEVRGRRDPLEARVLLLLAYLHVRRSQEFEALVLAHHADQILEASAKAPERLRLLAKMRLCNALSGFEDALEEREAALDEFMSLATSVPDAVAWSFTAWGFGTRAELLLDLGRVAQARDALEELRLRAASLPYIPWNPAHLELLLSRVEHREGELGPARERMARAQADLERQHGSAIEVDVQAGKLALEAGDTEGARGAFDGLMDRVEEAVECDPAGAARRLRHLLEIAHTTSGRPDLAREHVRATELAACDALRRVAELDRCVRELPEARAVPRSAFRVLVRHRERFVRRHAELLDVLAGLITAGSHAAARVFPPPRCDGGADLCVCAWCLCARSLDGAWLPVGQFAPQSARIRISHGICEDCAAELAG